MIHPAQRICSSEDFLYYAISGTISRYNIRSHEVSQLWKASSITEDEKKRNIQHRAIIEMALYSHYLIWFGEDKFLRVYDLQSNSELAERELVKRASALYVDNGTVFVGDKFGDVYVYPVLPDVSADSKSSVSTGPKAEDNGEEVPNALPVVGHVSMLTSVLLTPGEGQRYIISADRDEHIRVSKMPDGYNIKSFCLGHTQFVSSLVVSASRPEILVSGGGDEYLAYWNWNSGELRRKRYLSDAVALAKSENKGFAILKMLELEAVDLLVILVEGIKRIFLYNVHQDSDDAAFTIDLKAPALDVAVTGSKLWITYDTEITAQADSDKSAEEIYNIDCFSIDAASASRMDLSSLNKSCRTVVEKVEYTTHRADLMRKRTKAELEAARVALQQLQPQKAKNTHALIDEDLEREIEADKEKTNKKLKANEIQT